MEQEVKGALFATHEREVRESSFAMREREIGGTAFVAHELKAPLAILRQLALSLGEMDETNERLRLEMISVSERAIKQVNDLTKIHRLGESGIFGLEPISVREVCDAASRELDALFKYNRRGLTVNYHNHAKLVTANRDLLYSVVYNFLLNAMHYSGKDTCAELTVHDSRQNVKVSIRDYGPALPLDVWRVLKSGELRKPTGIAMRPGSSGLGLFIASQFSKYMNAKIGAVRHRDGTSFFVDLPVSRQASLFS